MTRFSEEQIERYSRHIVLPDVGGAGQQRLMEARVLLIGCGGLGSPAALYLAAAGVGHLGLVDSDTVDLSNLQRQILHTTPDLGRAKTVSAREKLAALNPGVRVDAHPVRLAQDNVADLIHGYDIVLDGTDNFPTRYLVNDACVARGLPLVHAGILRYEGQLTFIHPGHGPCYRCLYPEPPPPDEAPTCSQAGILGAVAGVLGSLQALEVLKYLLGVGDNLVGELLLYDARKTAFRKVKVGRDPACVACGGN